MSQTSELAQIQALINECRILMRKSWMIEMKWVSQNVNEAANGMTKLAGNCVGHEIEPGGGDFFREHPPSSILPSLTFDVILDYFYSYFTKKRINKQT